MALLSRFGLDLQYGLSGHICTEFGEKLANTNALAFFCVLFGLFLGHGKMQKRAPKAAIKRYFQDRLQNLEGFKVNANESFV